MVVDEQVNPMSPRSSDSQHLKGGAEGTTRPAEERTTVMASTIMGPFETIEPVGNRSGTHSFTDYVSKFRTLPPPTLTH